MTLLAILIIVVVVLRFLLRGEIQAAMDRDPAARNPWEIVLLYPSVHAIGLHRLAHVLQKMHLRFLARALSQFSRFLTGIEIHPGAQLAKGVFIDHGMGVVIGETTIVGENVTIFQGVTLGGTGNEKGKRHPTLKSNVVVGAGSKVLGNIVIGNNVRIGANAVVIKPVPDNSVVVGVPGRVVKQEGKRTAGFNLDHSALPDPLMQRLEKLQGEIDWVEEEIKKHHDDIAK